MTTGANVSLVARMVADVRSWASGVQQANNDLNTLKKTVQDNAVAARAAGVAFAGVVTGGILAAREAIKTYADFGQAIQNVASVAGATRDEFAEIEAAALRVGQTTRLSASQAADALYNLASAGFDTEQSIAALDGVTTLALATLADLGQASALTTSTIAQFGLDAAEASRVADTFANAIAKSPANMDRLTTAMRSAGPLAAALGISLEETTAAVSTLFKAGLEGGQAGANIRFFLTQLLNPTERAKETLERLGISLNEINPQIVGIAGALEALVEGGVTTGDALELFGTRGANAFLSLRAQGVDSLRELTDDVGTVGTASRIAAEQMSTFQGATDALASSTEALQIKIGKFLGAIVRPFVVGFTRIIDLLNALPAPISTIILALGVLASAVTAAGVAFVTFGGVMQGAGTRIGTLVTLLRTVPGAVVQAVVALRAKAAALTATTRATLALVAAQAKLQLRNLAPATLLRNLANLTRQLVAATAAQLGFNTAAQTGTGVIPRLTAAVRSFFRVLNANPIIRVITLALGALLLVVEGVRRNVGGLGDAWAEVMRSLEPLREAFAELGRTLAGPVATATGALGELFAAIAPILGGILTVAARVLAAVFIQLAYSIRTVANGAMFLKEVFTEGPLQAARNFADRQRQAFDEMTAGMSRVIGQAGALASSIDEVGDATENVADYTLTWVEQMERAQESLQGQALVDELTRILEAFDDNAQAVEGLAAALSEARSELSRLREEADGLTRQFSDRFEGMRISLIEDDEERRIAETRREFAKLREEIEKAAAANSEFARQAPALLSEAWAQEAAALARIRADAREARERDERRAAEELENLIRQREEAITNLVIQGTTNRLERARLEYEQRWLAADAMYRDLEERAQGNAEEMARIAALRAQELGIIETEHAEELADIYGSVYDKLEERGRAATRAALEAAGDQRAILSLNLEDTLRAHEEFFDQMLADAQGNAALLTQVEQERADDRERILRESFDAVMALRAEEAARMEEGEARITRARIEAADDLSALERLRYQERVDDANAYYDELAAANEGNAIELVRIAGWRNEELEILQNELNDILGRLDADAFAQGFRATVDALMDGLDDATEATLESTRKQLVYWRNTYRGNDGVVALVEEALGRVAALQDESARRAQEAADKRRETELDLVDAIEAAERRQARARAEAAGDLAEVRRIDYETERERVEKHYQDLLDAAEENVVLTLRLKGLRDNDLRDLQADFERDMIASTERINAAEADAALESSRRLREAISENEELAERVLEAQLRAARARTAAMDQVETIDRRTYERRLEEINVFYAEMEAMAGDNADMLTRIARWRNDELRGLWASYQQDSETALQEAEAAHQAAETAVRDRVTTGVAARKELGEALVEAEQRVTEARARASGDVEQIDRAEHRRRILETTRFYTELEQKARGNADALAAIAQLRNEEMDLLQQDFNRIATDYEPKTIEDAFQATVDGLLSGLDDANLATLRSMRTQLETWKSAYVGVDGIQAIVDRALGQVEQAYDRTTKAIAQSIDRITGQAAEFVLRIDTENMQRDMSQLERLWFDTAERVKQATALIRDLQGQLADANTEQAAAIRNSISELRRGIGVLQEMAVRDSRELARQAMAAFEKGMEDARARVSQAVARGVVTQVAEALRDVVAVNEHALRAARNELNSLMSRLIGAGFDEASLEQLRARAQELEDMLARIAENRAEFARQEYEHLRTVANAVLEETDARRFRLETLAREVDAYREALQGARDRGASLNDLRSATQNLTSAQLRYLGALEDEIGLLTSRRDALRGALPALQELAGILGQSISADAIRGQKTFVDGLWEQVLAAQRAGESFADYQALLQEATRAQTEYDRMARESITGLFRELQDAWREGGFLAPETQQQLFELTRLITEVFGGTFEDVERMIQRSIWEGVDSADPDFDFVDELEQRLTDIGRMGLDFDTSAPEAALEVFKNLNDEVLKAPEAAKALEAEIKTLEEQVADLQALIRDGIDFEAVAAGVISGYMDVLEKLGPDMKFELYKLGQDAIHAFGNAMIDERETLEAALEATLGGSFKTAMGTVGEVIEEATEEIAEEVEDAFGAAGEDAANAFADGVSDQRPFIVSTLQEALVETSEGAGMAAGIGLVNTFADGLRQNRSALLSEVEALLGVVRSYLPSSDAKRGPLSTLTASGRAFVRTFARGIEQAAPALDATLNRVLHPPSSPSTTLRGGSVAGAVGGFGPVYVNLPIEGRSAPADVAIPARALAKAALREVTMLQRMRGDD